MPVRDEIQHRRLKSLPEFKLIKYMPASFFCKHKRHDWRLTLWHRF
jgi:hypothetical protein